MQNGLGITCTFCTCFGPFLAILTLLKLHTGIIYIYIYTFLNNRREMEMDGWWWWWSGQLGPFFCVGKDRNFSAFFLQRRRRRRTDIMFLRSDERIRPSYCYCYCWVGVWQLVWVGLGCDSSFGLGQGVTVGLGWIGVWQLAWLGLGCGSWIGPSYCL